VKMPVMWAWTEVIDSAVGTMSIKSRFSGVMAWFGCDGCLSVWFCWVQFAAFVATGPVVAGGVCQPCVDPFRKLQKSFPPPGTRAR
jgi:hypothetical protein